VANVHCRAPGDGYQPAAGARAWHPQLRPYLPPGAAVRSCRSRLRTVADAPVAARRCRPTKRRRPLPPQNRHTGAGDGCAHMRPQGIQILRPGKPATGTVPRPAGGTLLGRPRQRRPPHRPPRRPNAATELHLSKPGCRHSNVDEGDVACGCPAPCRNRSRSSWRCPGRRRCSPAARIVEQQRAAERRRKVTPVDHATAASRKTPRSA
jgi:hypothetical protein